MTTDLIPEVRVDKNGVPVTRHVKPQTAKGGKALPQPSLQPARVPYPEREAHTNELLERSLAFAYDEGFTDDEFMNVLSGYSDGTLRLLHEHVGDNASQTYYAEFAGIVRRKLPETMVREFVMFAPTVADCEDLDETIRYVNGLHHYKALNGVDDLTLADEDTKAVSHALLRIAFHVHCMNEYGADDHPAAKFVPDPKGWEWARDRECPVLGSERLVSLVVQNADRSSDIAEYVEESGFTTVKAIQQMLEGTHHATRHGWL